MCSAKIYGSIEQRETKTNGMAKQMQQQEYHSVQKTNIMNYVVFRSKLAIGGKR